MRIRALLTLLLTLELMSAAAGAAQINVIRGKVYSKSGQPVNNAIVELRMGGGAIIGQTVTRNEGDFAFTGLSAGEYEVHVTMAGYEPAGQLVRFMQSPRDNFQEVLRVEVMLRPKADAQAAGPPGVHFAQDVPKPARDAFEKGLMRLREGKSEEGLGHIRHAIDEFPEYFNAHFALGAELYRLDRLEEAIESLEQARKINDREGAVYYVFGLVMIKQRKFAVAEYAFRESGRLAGGNASTRFYRGLVLIELAMQTQDRRQQEKDLSEADKELKAAFEMSDRKMSAVHLQRARLLELRGRKDDAVRELEAYLKAEPDARNADSVREAISRLRGSGR